LAEVAQAQAITQTVKTDLHQVLVDMYLQVAGMAQIVTGNIQAATVASATVATLIFVAVAAPDMKTKLHTAARHHTGAVAQLALITTHTETTQKTIALLAQAAWEHGHHMDAAKTAKQAQLWSGTLPKDIEWHK
jgi:hypothetical protein